MKGLAPEIDRLMWKIAEDRDEGAAGDFSEQFPHLRQELEGRMSMVRNLRGAKSSVGGSISGIPQFEPRFVPMPLYANRTVWVAAVAALAAIGIASYWVTSTLVKPEPVVVSTKPLVHVAPSKKEDLREFTGLGFKGTQERTPETHTAPATQAPPEPAPPPEVRPDVTFSSTPLLQVLQAVASEAKLTLELAPKMPNPNVDAHYQGLTGLEILADLGKRFGFKAFPQDGRKVLVVPTIEAWEPNTDVTGDTAVSDLGGN